MPAKTTTTTKAKTTKTAAKKTTAKKTVAKKTTTKKKAATGTAAARTTTLKNANIMLQWAGNDVSFDQIRSNIIAQYSESGKTEKDIKKLEVYVKPEEGLAYYVINGTDTGDVGLF